MSGRAGEQTVLNVRPTVVRSGTDWFQERATVSRGGRVRAVAAMKLMLIAGNMVVDWRGDQVAGTNMRVIDATVVDAIGLGVIKAEKIRISTVASKD